MVERTPHKSLWPSLVWHTYVSDIPYWLGICFDGWNIRFNFYKWNTSGLGFRGLRFCHDCLSILCNAISIGIQHKDINTKHMMQVATTNDKYYYVLIDWGHVILEERQPFYFSKIFFHICLSKGKTLSYI